MKRFSKRKTYRKRRPAPRRMKGRVFNKRVRSVIRRLAEVKSDRLLNTETNVLSNTFLFFQAYNTGLEGTGSEQRIGQKVNTKSMVFRWAIKNVTDFPVFLRVMLIKARDTGEGVNTASTIWEGVGGEPIAMYGDIRDINAELAHSKFVMVTNKVYTLSQQLTDYSFMHRVFFIPGQSPAHFASIVATFPTNKRAYLIVIARRADNDSTVSETLAEFSVERVHRYIDL